MRSILKTSLLAISSFVGLQADAQITVAPNLTASQMIEAITGANVTVSNAVLTCPDSASGTFIVTGTNLLALDSGIVLTTGYTDYIGSPVGYVSSKKHNTPGDPELSNTISTATYDACRLEFDFSSPFDTVLFYYSFASEEYPEYTCSQFNDAFGFYVSGPGITGTKNIALVPGTNIPVAINSINPGYSASYPFANCTNMGTGSPFPNYFIYAEALGATDFIYDGLSTVLEAKLPILQDSLYHMRIVVADAVDSSFDSAVFLEGSSFTAKPAIPTTSIPQYPKNAKFIIAPSPSEEFISIYVGNDVYGKNVAACIQNEMGQSVYNYNGTSANLSADMKLHTTTLAPGNYFVTISVTGEGLREVKKVQKLK